MKLKYNEAKDTYSIKGLSVEDLQLLGALMNYVRLGSASVYSESAFEVADLLARELGDDFHSDVYLYFSLDEYGVAIEVEDSDCGYDTGSLIAGPDVNVSTVGCQGCLDCDETGE